MAVGHNEFHFLSIDAAIGGLFKSDIPDNEKVLIDVKSLYRMDELKASGLRFWRRPRRAGEKNSSILQGSVSHDSSVVT